MCKVIYGHSQHYNIKKKGEGVSYFNVIIKASHYSNYRIKYFSLVTQKFVGSVNIRSHIKCKWKVLDIFTDKWTKSKTQLPENFYYKITASFWLTKKIIRKKDFILTNLEIPFIS